MAAYARQTAAALLAFGVTTSIASAKSPASAVVDFSACANMNVALGAPVGVTKGNTTAKDAKLPFLVLDPNAGNNAWTAATGGSLVITTSVPAATTVNMLLNTLYGQASVTNATVVLKGTGGARQTIRLSGNKTIRDYNNWVWTNTIDNTKAQEWWTNNFNPQPQDQSHRMDAHVFKLNSSFAGQSLTSITVTAPSNAGTNFMQPLLWAISVEYPGASGTVSSSCQTG